MGQFLELLSVKFAQLSTRVASFFTGGHKSIPAFYMLVGLPGSGKSTYTDGFSGIIVSSDSIRQELYGDENIQGNPRDVFGLAYKRIIEGLKSGEDVMFDATNLKRADRVSLMVEINSQVKVSKLCVFMDVSLENCLKRNKLRERKVPEEVIMRMHRTMQYPGLDEGWDLIVRMKNE